MHWLLTRVGWLFTFVTIGTLIANEVSDDPEYYVPVIAATLAAASVLLAGRLRRKSDEANRPQ